jgi:hypothetical protein
MWFGVPNTITASDVARNLAELRDETGMNLTMQLQVVDALFLRDTE